MKNKIVVLIIFLAFSSLWFGCSSEKKEDSKVIKIGAILPLTGGASYIGNSVLKGLQLANDSYKNDIELIYKDSQGIPKNAISIYNKLLSINHIRIFIPVFSGVTNALIPLADKDSTLLFATTVSSSDITHKSQNLFRLFVNANNDAKKIAQFAIDSLHYKKFYIIYVNDDFGQDYSKTFKKTIINNSGIILGEDSYGRNDLNFKNIINAISFNKSKIDAIYLLGYDNNMIPLFKQYFEAKINIPILTIATVNQPEIRDQIISMKPSNIDIYFTNTTLYKKDNNKIKDEFFYNFKKKFNDKPNYFSAFAYDLLNIIHKAQKRNGKIITESILDNEFEGVMGKIKFDKFGDANFPMIIEHL